MRNSKRYSHFPKIESREISFDEMNSQDLDINSLAEEIKRKIKANILLTNIPFLADNYTFDLLLYSIRKQKKTKNDILFIAHYLTTFSKFFNHKKNVNYDYMEMLSNVAANLVYEKYQKNTIIFKFGDVGDKYYLILKGKVSVIIKREYTCQMCTYEYIKYLEFLLSLDEKELYEVIVTSNKLTITPMEISLYLSKKIDIENENPSKNQQIKYNFISKNIKTISTEEYINAIAPKFLDLSEEKIKRKTLDKKPIILWTYYKVCELGKNTEFGDVGLGETEKRTATIITEEETAFGVISKEIYDKYLKEIIERNRRSKIVEIVNCEILSGISAEDFDKNYFNHFKEFTIKQGDTLFEQGSQREEVYFLREGEIEISIKSSFPQLSNMLLKKNLHVDDSQYIKWCKENLFFRNYYYNASSTFKLFKNKEKGFIGLNDLVDSDNKYIFSVVCKSSKCVLYSIYLDIFNQLLEKEKRINISIQRYVNLKNKLILDRISKLKYILLEEQFTYFLKRTTITDDNELNKKSNRSSVLNSNNNFIKVPMIKLQKKTQNNQIQSREKRLAELSRIDKAQINLKLNLSALQNQNSKIKLRLVKHNKNKSVDNTKPPFSERDNKNLLSNFRKRKPKDYEPLNGCNISFSLENTERKESKQCLTNNTSLLHQISNSNSLQTTTRRILLATNEGSNRKLKEIRQKVISSAVQVNMEKKNIYSNALEKYLHYSLFFRRRKKEQITKDNTVILSKVDILGMDKVIEASEPKLPTKEYHPKNVIQNIKNYTNIAKKIKEHSLGKNKKRLYRSCSCDNSSNFGVSISKYSIKGVFN